MRLRSEGGSLEGIIAHLTKTHDRNVHDKRVVTTTSKLVVEIPGYGPRNVADLSSDSYFCSMFEPGANWTELDRRAGQQDFRDGEVEGRGRNKVSFTISHPTESRFIRLTQTDKNLFPDHQLLSGVVEFFGKLIEPG
jgi:hypothetical protein